MPFIDVKTNIPVPADKAETVKAALGRAITALPGKSESWLMVCIEPEKQMWFKGDSAPLAMVQVQTYGVNAQGSDKLTAQITEILSTELGLSPDRIYVALSGTPNWGWNGSNF